MPRAKKDPNVTPTSKIVHVLRKHIWLFSAERRAAIKREHNTCQRCHKKGSVAKGKEVKIQVHHKDGIDNWKEVAEVIRDKILCPPDRLEVLCKECHKKVEGR